MSVGFQMPVINTHQVGIGTDAIKENRTAVVLAETALMDVTASRKTFAPVMKNHHISARPARTTAHAVYKRWKKMSSTLQLPLPLNHEGLGFSFALNFFIIIL